jgi:hypothetical protein
VSGTLAVIQPELAPILGPVSVATGAISANQARADGDYAGAALDLAGVLIGGSGTIQGIRAGLKTGEIEALEAERRLVQASGNLDRSGGLATAKIRRRIAAIELETAARGYDRRAAALADISWLGRAVLFRTVHG